MSAIITKIDPRSPAEKAGLQVGETLLTIGGRAIRDVLDYKFYAYDPALTLEVQGKVGAKRTVKIRKQEGQDQGDLPEMQEFGRLHKGVGRRPHDGRQGLKHQQIAVQSGAVGQVGRQKQVAGAVGGVGYK